MLKCTQIDYLSTQARPSAYIDPRPLAGFEGSYQLLREGGREGGEKKRGEGA